MKRTFLPLYIFMILAGTLPPGNAASSAPSGDVPKPFGFAIDRTSYPRVVDMLKKRGWTFDEYDKRHFKTLDASSPRRGRNTFLRVRPEGLDDITGITLFFGGESMLDAVILNVDPKLFNILMDELDGRYKLVKRHLSGQHYTSDYPFVLWERDGVYIELQQFTTHHVRLLYVDKLRYENYRDFLYKTFEPFRTRQNRKAWMDDL